LIDAELIERRVDRDAHSGRFGAASYRLHLERAGLVLSPGHTDRAEDPRTEAHPAKPTARRRADVGQLSFLDEEAV
jgi:hypothetical protein